MSTLVKQCKNRREEPRWGAQCGLQRGYYLCVRVDGSETKHWFGETFRLAKLNLERASNTWLTEVNGWRYTIEYSHGPIANGTVGWGNLDLTDQFLD